MNNEDTNLDLLDLDGDTNDTLPEVAFTNPRPKRPWLLLGIGLVVIALATYVIVRTVGSDSSSTVEIDLDAAPEVVVDGGDMPVPTPTPDANSGALPMPAPVAAQTVAVQPNTVKPVADTESNVRVVEDRKNAVFNPDKPSTEIKPVEKKTEVKPVAAKTTAAKTAATKTTAKTTNTKKVEKTSASASWYVQFGSYATRDAANAAGQKMRAAHASLFAGKQFVVLASVLKDGRTTYRLRVAFTNSSDANGFCRNAKSDGLDCYVAK